MKPKLEIGLSFACESLDIHSFDADKKYSISIIKLFKDSFRDYKKAGMYQEGDTGWMRELANLLLTESIKMDKMK